MNFETYRWIFSACLSKIHWRVYRNWILCVRKNIYKQIFLKTQVFFYLFWTLKGNFSPSSIFLSAEVVKTTYYVSIRTFWWKFLSWERVFLINFKIQWNISENVKEISTAGLSKSHYTSPGKQFEEKSCFLKKKPFVSFSDIDKKFTAEFFTFLGAVVKTVFYLSRRLFWKNKYIFWSRIYLIIFRYWANIFQPFVVIFWTVLSKLHSKCPKKI